MIPPPDAESSARSDAESSARSDAESSARSDEEARPCPVCRQCSCCCGYYRAGWWGFPIQDGWHVTFEGRLEVTCEDRAQVIYFISARVCEHNVRRA